MIGFFCCPGAGHVWLGMWDRAFMWFGSAIGVGILGAGLLFATVSADSEGGAQLVYFIWSIAGTSFNATQALDAYKCAQGRPLRPLSRLRRRRPKR